MKRKKLFSFLLVFLIPCAFAFADEKSTIKGTISQVKQGTSFLGLGTTIEKFVEKIAGLVTGINTNRNAQMVFYLFIAIFAIANTFLFIYNNNVMKEKKQWSDLLSSGFKAIICVLIMTLLPRIPQYLISFMWKIAEFILGQEAGTMGYALPLRNFGGVITSITSGIGTSLSVVSVIDPAVMGNKIISGTSLSNFGSLVFTFGIAGFVATLSATILYAVSCIQMYIAIFLMILHLPSVIFDGFNTKFMSVIKFFWLNSLKVFLGAVIILVICSLSYGDINGIVTMLTAILIKPLLLTILLPITSGLINAISQGGVTSDDAHSVAHGLGQATGSLIMGGKAIKGSGESIIKDLKGINARIAEEGKILDMKNSLAKTWAKAHAKNGELTEAQQSFFQNMDTPTAQKLKASLDMQEAMAQMKKFASKK